MNIQKIYLSPQYSTQNLKINKKTEYNTTPAENKEYKPAFYKDYNINFGARLFRTPENFYEQDFNRTHMPKAMKEYLDADYEERKQMAPALLLKTVYEDIDYAVTLEDVRDYYSEQEPLFANLHTPNKKFREGILAEIEVMKEEGTPLFKSGENDLGMYILKKIYREGKTLNEINKDFRQDITPEYEALSDITYSTVNDFGIKFPDIHFWKSFIATREDFPYEYKPRSAGARSQSGRNELSIHDINTGNIPQGGKKEKPKFNPKDHEVDKYKDIILTSMGNKDAAEKEYNKHSISKKDEKTIFIQKYMSEIMSIALERVHASEEMTDFFENYENLDKSNKIRLKKYWEASPEMKALQSIIMSDTIKLFFITYGADGNNEEFQDLLNYAHSIKPNREEQKRRHNELQEEYERELGIFTDTTTEETKECISPKVLSSEEIEHEKMNRLHNMKPYTLIAMDGTKMQVRFNIEEAMNAFVHSQFDDYFAQSFINKYSRYMQKYPEATDKYKISLVLRTGTKIDPEWEKFLMTEDEISSISQKINRDFRIAYPKENRAMNESFVKILSDKTYGICNPARLYELSTFDIISMFEEIKLTASKIGISSSLLDELKNGIDSLYKEYLTPLSTSELTQIMKQFEKYMNNFDETKLENNGYSRPKNFGHYITALSIYLQNAETKDVRKFYSLMTNFIKNNYGPSAKSIIDNSLSDTTHGAKIEDIILYYISQDTKGFGKMLCSNEKSRLYLMSISK